MSNFLTKNSFKLRLQFIEEFGHSWHCWKSPWYMRMIWWRWFENWGVGDNEFWIVFVIGNSIGLPKNGFETKKISWVFHTWANGTCYTSRNWMWRVWWSMLDCGVFCNNHVAIMWFRKLISRFYLVWDDYLF